MATKTKQHRWKQENGMHYRPGLQCSICKVCGVERVEEYGERFYALENYKWRRYAPPCPPDERSKEMAE